MLLDELIEVIETLKQRITVHGSALRENETRTRMALIDPLLQVLGWDTSDPSLVIPEYSVGGGKADYALLSKEGHPTAAIEAKRLDEPLQSHLMQMVSYSAMAGIKYAGITNGDQWELYDVLRPVALTERRMLSLKISDSSPYFCALKLLLLWRPNLSSEKAVPANTPIDVPLPKIDPVPPIIAPMEWTPLSKFSVHKTKNHPEFIRFPDESERPLQAWYDLVLQTVGWLWSKGILTAGNISDYPIKGRYLFHTEAVHMNGKPFFNPKPVAGTPLVVEANMSRVDSVKRTNALLGTYGQDLTRVHLGVKRK